MTAPQNGPQEGQNGSEGSQEGQTGQESGSGGQEGATGGTEGQEGAQALTYADVIAALSDEQRNAVIAEVSKKNSEARRQRERAKAAEDRLGSTAGSGSSGQNGSQEGQQSAAGGNGSQEGQQSTAQLEAARAAVARSKVEAIAATAGFADPEDAAALLGDLSSYVERDFTVDAEAIRSDVEELLVKKPHLGGQKAAGGGSGRPGRPKPDGSQGSSAAGGSGPKRGGVEAGAELYRSKHKRPAAGTVQTTSS